MSTDTLRQTTPEHRRRRTRAVALMLITGCAITLLRAGVVVAFFGAEDATSPARAAAGVLHPPTEAHATALGGGAVRVSWTAPADQLPGVQYQVRRTSGPSAPSQVCTVEAGVTFCDDTDLLPGTEYGFEVAAVRHSWTSGPVAAGSATTAVPTLDIVLNPSTSAAGSPISIVSITARLGAAVDTTYRGAKSLSWAPLDDSPAGAHPTPPSSASIQFVAGAAAPGYSFVPVASGAASLTASDAAAPAVHGSAAFTVDAATADRLAFTRQPVGATVGTPLSTQPEVSVTDQYGNTVATGPPSASNITLGLSSGTFGVPNGSSTASLAATNGVAAFSGLRVDRAGATPYTLTATAPALVSATSNGFSITAAAAHHLAVTTQPVSAITAGDSVSVGVEVRDAFDNAVTTGAGAVQQVRATLSTGTFAGGSITQVSTAGGVSTLSGLRITSTDGTPYTITVSDAAAVLTPATTAPVSVSPAAPSKLVFTSPPVSGPMSTKGNLGPITVEQQDEFGNPTTSNQVVSLTQTGGTGTGSFAATSLGAPISDVALGPNPTASFYFGSTTGGTKTITATAAGLTPATTTAEILVPAGLSLANVVALGPSTTPTVTCGPFHPFSSCNVSGLGTNGGIDFDIRFVGSGGAAMVYSATDTAQVKLTDLSGTVTLGTATITAGSSTTSTHLSLSFTGTTGTLAIANVTLADFNLVILLNA